MPADYPPHLLRELAARMAARGKVFDVMNDPIYWSHKSSIAPRRLTAQYVELVKLFAAEGVLIQVSSDNHRTGVGNTRWSQLLTARAAVPAEQIVDPRKIVWVARVGAKPASRSRPRARSARPRLLKRVAAAGHQKSSTL